MGDHAGAAEQMGQALDLFFRILDDRLGEANTLQDLGRTRTQLSNYAVATDLLARSRMLFEEIGDSQGGAETLNSTGDLLTKSGTPQQALASYRQALLLARQVHSPLNEAHSLEGIVRCEAPTDTQAAIASLREAVSVYQRIGAAAETPAANEYLANLEAGQAWSRVYRSPGDTRASRLDHAGLAGQGTPLPHCPEQAWEVPPPTPSRQWRSTLTRSPIQLDPNESPSGRSRG